MDIQPATLIPKHQVDIIDAVKRPPAFIKSLPHELIERILTYLAEGEKGCACISFQEFFISTTTVVYHVDAINTSRKRKRSVAAQAGFDTYRQNVWDLLQNPDDAARLRNITLLQPFDYSTGSKRHFSQLGDLQKYRGTALVQKDAQVDRIIDIIGRNASQLRFFETTLLRPLNSLLQALTKLVELKIPSTTSLQDVTLPSLRSLIVVHSSISNPPADLPSIPSLQRLEIQLNFHIIPTTPAEFVDLNLFPNLREIMLTGTNTGRIFGHNKYPSASIFRNYSSSLRRVSVYGPFIFETFECLRRWLTQLSTETLHDLCLKGIEFGYSPYEGSWLTDSEVWPDMPQLRSLELLGGRTLSYFRTLPCSRLQKLFVSSQYGPNIDTDAALAQLLEIVKSNLTTLSIIEYDCPSLRCVNQYHYFSAGLTDKIARCLALRHFETVGRQFFELNDWRFLCARVFPDLHLLHMEAHQPKLYVRLDDLDQLCMHNKKGAEISSPKLKKLYGGRVYVADDMSSWWVGSEHKGTIETVKYMEYDQWNSATNFLCQHFRQQVNMEGDLDLVRIDSGLSGWKELGPVPPPRILDPIQCKHPC